MGQFGGLGCAQREFPMIRLLFLALLLASVTGSQANMLMAPTTAGAPPSGCAQATTFLARTSGENTSALTTLICGMVTAGIIDGDMSATGCGTTIDRWFIGQVANSTDALLNLCSDATPQATDGGAAFVANSGWHSNGGHVSSQFAPSTDGVNFTQNDASVGLWSLSDSSTSGADVSNDNIYIAARYGDNNAYCSINDAGGGGSGIPVADGLGYYVCERTGASASQLYKSATLIWSPNITSTALSASSVLYAENTDKTIAMVMFAKHLTSGQITTINSLYGTYCAAVRGSSC